MKNQLKYSQTVFFKKYYGSLLKVSTNFEWINTIICNYQLSPKNHQFDVFSMKIPMIFG